MGGVSHSDSGSARSRTVVVGDLRRAERALPLLLRPGAQLRKQPWLGSSQEGTRPAFSSVGASITSQLLGSWLPTRVSGGMVLSVTPWRRLGIQAAVASCSAPGWPQFFCSLDTRCRLRGALSSQPLAPTRHGKPSSEAAPTKEREGALENCQPPPRSEGTAPGHAHQRPGSQRPGPSLSPRRRCPRRETAREAA